MNFKLEPNKPVNGTTDWKKLDSMTEEVHADALSDPDNPPLTEKNLNPIHQYTVGGGPCSCPVNGQPRGVAGDIGQPRGVAPTCG